MGSEKGTSSDLVDNVRNMSISRRGGVRTRGGRLPPLRMRDIAQVTGAKKTVAPKIPQRRTPMKKEVSEESKSLIKKEPMIMQRGERGRGRGRGSKVFLQMEGTFLADGPALRVKKESMESESYSFSRSSRSRASEQVLVKIDSNTMEDLLSSYEPSNVYEDDFGTIPPYRLPLVKYEGIQKIKVKPPDVDIKSEPLDEDDIEAVKKDEDDTWNNLEGKFLTKIKTEAPSAAEDHYDVKDEDTLVLLQWPQCLPFAEDQPTLDDKQKEGDQSKSPLSFLDNLPEGKIGKLQVMKSGRKKLVLGSIAFELVDGAVSKSSKEVAIVRMDEHGGDVTVVGPIDKTVVVRPLMKEIMPEEGEDDNM